jgi:hypothetical protein
VTVMMVIIDFMMVILLLVSVQTRPREIERRVCVSIFVGAGMLTGGSSVNAIFSRGYDCLRLSTDLRQYSAKASSG